MSLIEAASSHDDSNLIRSPQDIQGPLEIVRTVMDEHGIEVLFDGSLSCSKAPSMSRTANDLDDYLSKLDVSRSWLIDEVMEALRATGSKVSQIDIERALRIVTRLERRQRKSRITRDIAVSLSSHELERARQQWQDLVEGVFQTDCNLSIGVLQHFIWQVKQQLLERPISRPLMPIVYSPIKGSGTTTFVLKLLGPIRELASTPILVSDLNGRNHDLYRFPVLVVDDMEQLLSSQIPVLKGLMSPDNFRRRSLRASKNEHIVQCATLIGTADSAVGELVADKAGNNRLVALQFHNRSTVDAINRQVWDIVQAADYELLWRSVDAYGPPPIDVCLELLSELQNTGRISDELEIWLHHIDFKSSDIKTIVNRGKVQCRDLYDLFREQTGSKITLSSFGTAMYKLSNDPLVPFERRRKVEKGRVYPVKQGFVVSQAASSADQ